MSYEYENEQLNALADVLTNEQIQYLQSELKRSQRKAKLSPHFKSSKRDRLRLLKQNISNCRNQQ